MSDNCPDYLRPPRGNITKSFSQPVPFFKPVLRFIIETSHLIFTGNQITGFYMKYKTGLKWVIKYMGKFFVTVERLSQPAFTCSKLTIETLEQGVKYVQS